MALRVVTKAGIAAGTASTGSDDGEASQTSMDESEEVAGVCSGIHGCCKRVCAWGLQVPYVCSMREKSWHSRMRGAQATLCLEA